MTERIDVEVTAKDNASKVIQRVADEAEDLEKLSPEIIVAADDHASADLDQVMARAKALDGDTATVILEAEAARAEGAIRNVQLLLGRVDGAKAEALVTAKDNASKRLDRIRSELRELDGQTADVTVDVQTRGLDKLEGALGAIPNNLGNAATSLLSMARGSAGLATGLGAAAVAAGAVADNSGDAALQMSALSQLTGESVESTSQLATIWQSTGADINDLADVLLQVNGVLAQQPGLAAQLGVELKGASPQKVFEDVLDALGDMEPGFERNILLSQLLGEEGARQGSRLIDMYNDVSEASDEVEAPFDADDARRAQSYQKATAELSQAMTKLGASLGEVLLPAMTEAAEGAADLVGGLIDLRDEAERLLFETETNNVDALEEIKAANEKTIPVVEKGADAAGRQADEMSRIPGPAADAAEKLQRVADAIQNQVDAQTALMDLNVNAADLAIELADAQRGQADAFAATTAARIAHAEAIATATPEDDVAAARDLRDAILGERDAAIEAAKTAGELAAANATLAGDTLTAQEKTRTLNESLVESATTATPEARAQIIKYIADINNISEERATEIVANADTVGADTALDTFAAETRTTYVSVNADLTPAERKLQSFLINAANKQVRVGVGIGLLQAGGPAAAGQPYIVGEKGPELFVPRNSGTVVPNRQINIEPSSSRSGGNMTVNVNLPRGSRPDDVISAINKHARRNGGRRIR